MNHEQTHIDGKEPTSGIAAAHRIKLVDMLGDEPAILSASLSTVDGRSISFFGQPSTGQAQRVGAISSSFMGLSEAFTKETSIGGTLHAAIAGDSGTLITVRVPSNSRVFVLSLCADRSINMAMALRCALDASERIAKVLDQPAN